MLTRDVDAEIEIAEPKGVVELLVGHACADLRGQGAPAVCGHADVVAALQVLVVEGLAEAFRMQGDHDLAAGLAFAGDGITAPAKGYDDYAGLDVRGKVLVMLVDDPPATTKGCRPPGGPCR